MTYGTLISTQTIGAGGALSIDFNSIPQTYTDIMVVVSGRTNSTTTSSGNFGDILIKFNGSTSGYNERQLYSIMNGSSSSSNGGFYTSTAYLGGMNGANTTANCFSTAQLYIPNYTSAINKSFFSDNMGEQNSTNAFSQIVANSWSNTNAITSISIYPLGGIDAWVQYTTASLYGIK